MFLNKYGPFQNLWHAKVVSYGVRASESKYFAYKNYTMIYRGNQVVNAVVLYDECEAGVIHLLTVFRRTPSSTEPPVKCATGDSFGVKQPEVEVDQFRFI
jgi:hypothetical protein